MDAGHTRDHPFAQRPEEVFARAQGHFGQDAKQQIAFRLQLAEAFEKGRIAISEPVEVGLDLSLILAVAGRTQPDHQIEIGIIDKRGDLAIERTMRGNAALQETRTLRGKRERLGDGRGELARAGSQAFNDLAKLRHRLLANTRDSQSVEALAHGARTLLDVGCGLVEFGLAGTEGQE